jgi:hypothetical protein
VLNIQIFALTLVPLLAGAVTTDGKALIAPMAVLGIEESVSADFLVGTWQYSEEFFRWGITDTKRAQVRTSRGRGLMTLNRDGTIEMEHLFRPAKGKWELNDRGLLIYDPRFPERGTQLLQIRKRDKDHMWVLLPFSGGATGIGLARVIDRSEIRREMKERDRSERSPVRSRSKQRQPREEAQPRAVPGWDPNEADNESSPDFGD